MIDLIGIINSNLLLLGIVFIFFVLSLKRSVKILFNAAIIAAAATIIPVLLNKMFDIPFPTDGISILHFILFGLFLYFIWLIGKSIYTILGNIEKFFGKLKNIKTD